MRDDMLAAALRGYTPLKPFYASQEVSTLSHKVIKHLRGDEIYPTKYLFGWNQEIGQTKGILQSYFEKGYNVCLMAESKVDSIIRQDFSAFDVIDVQYATVSTGIVKEWLSQNIKVVGWAPPEFASKLTQAIFVSQRCNNKPFLPKQVLLPRGTSYNPKLGKKCVDLFECEYVILKHSFGAASHGCDSFEYNIVKKESLINVLPDYLKKVWESRLEQDIIISELIMTDDPYAGHANHVIHKAHCISKYLKGKKKPEVDFVGNICPKIVSNGDFGTVRKEAIPISKLIPSSYWSIAHLSCIEYINEFLGLIKFFGSVGCVFTVDFMIPPDGFPRFLEINKLAATFADIFDPNCGSALDQSTNLINFKGITPDIQLKWVEKLENEIRSLEKDGFLTNPVLASKNGVELLK